MKYKNRLTFAHYSITFLDFKSLQEYSKNQKKCQKQKKKN